MYVDRIIAAIKNLENCGIPFVSETTQAGIERYTYSTDVMKVSVEIDPSSRLSLNFSYSFATADGVESVEYDQNTETVELDPSDPECTDMFEAFGEGIAIFLESLSKEQIWFGVVKKRHALITRDIHWSTGAVRYILVIKRKLFTKYKYFSSLEAALANGDFKPIELSHLGN